ncbi:hypothetical protein VHEMI00301 [[Torrubiella] hemipterigena]|uniref:Carrier domain-containing protein n=1 Tax=[Torrubiella] hemipterigena TaxID=1531966 RepID=A0A0A1SQ32_9HYPO|nr:hypothetical protein VHEMI00301 [[Torrubiella] hemipterigena]
MAPFISGEATQKHSSSSPLLSVDRLDDSTTLYEQASQYFGIGREEIEAILPCTPFQCDIVDCAAKDKALSIGHVSYRIPQDVDIDLLAAAWKETVRQSPALRTSIFQSQEGAAFQVVLRQSFVFSRLYLTSVDLLHSVVQDETAAAASGSRCNRFALLDDADARERLLIWTFSHSLVDAALRKHTLARVLMTCKEKQDELIAAPDTPDPSEEAKSDRSLPSDSFDLPKAPTSKDMEHAAQFWKQRLGGLNASSFPSLPNQLASPSPRAYSQHCISFLAADAAQRGYSATTLCRSALAILLSHYSHSPEALFGVVVEGHGSGRAVVPMRVHCASDLLVSDFITKLHADDEAMRKIPNVGLRAISNIGDDGSTACGFQTVLRITNDSDSVESDEIHQLVQEPEEFVPCANRALLLSCRVVSTGASLTARYDEGVISSNQVARLLRQFGGLIRQLQSSSDSELRLGQLDMATTDDKEEIQGWNSEPLVAKDTLLHTELLRTALSSPNQPAISAWDGDWTYAELDNVSTQLAEHLESVDFGKEQAIVPLYFEKSKWVVASMLAVLKAGHAFTLIDPKDPPGRVSQVVEQSRAAVALTSKLHHNTVQGLVGRGIVVDDDLVTSKSSGQEPRVKSAPKSNDLSYVIFTSGSTGTPKGIMIEHHAFASCATKFGPALGITNTTRALQFGSHAFGACLLEVMTTLIHGGCVCIPSDDDRMNDVPGFINRFSVNWVMATPSYMGTFQPDDVPGLQTLVLVGEQMLQSVNNIWAPRLNLLNGYGQSESSSLCSVASIQPNATEPNNIGRMVGAHAWIVDPNNSKQLAAIGAVGELVIESPGIARDYIIPLLQDQSPFIALTPAWYPQKQLPRGSRLYKTGDFARYASDGTVVCLGRMDSQVKIRGQRVEMGAVETCLRQQLPKNVTVVAEAITRSDSSHSKVLAAFLIGSVPGTKDTKHSHILSADATNGINTKLQQVLPPFSVPVCYISMQDLPRTATGKVDRRRLRSLGAEILSQQTHETEAQSTQTSTEIPTDIYGKLEKIWFQSLKTEPNPSNKGASFFEMGGDSITAIKMVNMARSAGINLKVSDILRNSTLTSLAAIITGSSGPLTTIPKLAQTGPVEQSYAQGRLWFLDQLEIGASWYLIPYAVRMRGSVDVRALTSALLALEQRHETLRTTFANNDGGGVQIVHKKLAKELRVIDVSGSGDDGYLESLRSEQTAPFDLTVEAGWRAALIRLSDTDHVLSIVMHHIISDGWSIDILRRDLGQLYTAALAGVDPLSAMKPLPIQYVDFSVWQKQEAQAKQHEKQLQYWQKQLADCSPAKFPTDFPRPALLSGDAGVVPVTIDGELYQKLRSFCNTHQVTSFSVLLATFRAAHYRLTGVDDAVIGRPIANRNRWELEDMIGFFVNTQCMRITVDDDDTFESLVHQVRATTTAAFENEDVPFERVVSALLPGSRDLSQTPLAQLMFAVHSQKDLGKFELQNLETQPLTNKAYTRFDIEFHLFQQDAALTGALNFAMELFTPESMQNVVNVFFEILHGGLDQPQTPISLVPLTSGIPRLEKMGLLQINDVEYPRDSNVVDIFRAQAASCPDAMALIDSSSRLTYAELDHQSDRLAAWLRRQNLAPETLVGVLAPRSCQTIVAFFGILKANLAYIPLDVRSPIARVKDILSTISGRAIVLLGDDVAVPELQLPELELVRISEALKSGNPNDSLYSKDLAHPSATSLAYVLFTSGSTGKPKGVMIEHRVIVRLVKGNIIPHFPPQPIMAHMYNIAFDGATYEIFGMLLNGGTLVCVDYMTTLDGKALSAVYAQEQINVAMMAPALLKLYLVDARDALKNLDLLLVAGDRFDRQDAIESQALIRGQCYNLYGPTENGVLSTVYNVAPDDPFVNGVPLGWSINNSGAFITDANQQLVGAGVMGELVVTGDGLGRGYTDPALDVNRFIQFTVKGKTVRAYRTGDRVRYRVNDGLIEFFGRMDFQFKIRGNRIESAEVEAAILSNEAVRDTAVVVRGEEGQELEMVGFIVANDNISTEKEETDNQVEGWQELFDGGMYSDIDTISPESIGNDFKGWTSMYDGNDIDKTEMQEWLDDTMATLHDGQSPGHVLEIGTGSGMILFNLGPELQSYIGLEPSKSAAAWVNGAIKAIPAYSGKAQVHVGTAADIDKLGQIRTNLVVINSVAQYFPTPEYLTEVIDTLVRIPGLKRIFFGDMRSQATNRHFLAARAIFTLGNNASKHDVQQKIAELEEREEEFLVEPAYFTTLQDLRPDLIRHVEIIPKNMQATNELSAYRYAAVVHLHASDDEAARPLHDTKDEDWIDFAASQMDRESLLALLKLSKDKQTVCVSNIPYSKTIFERHILESLERDGMSGEENNLDGAAWISSMRSEAEKCASLAVPELVKLAKQSGFSVEVSAARQWSQSGGLDAVFHHYPSSETVSRTLVRFPTDNKVRASFTLANRPLQRLQRRRAALQVREHLQSLVPSYMIPAHIIALDQMPINANGKVDRKELARRARIIPTRRPAAPTPVPVFPISDIEVILCEQATEAFGMDVKISDHFFELGGHSLLATKLIARIGQHFHARVTVKDVFDHPIFADLAAVIRQRLALQDPIVPDGGLAKDGQSARVAPRTEIESILCEEFATVLGIQVGITDNFFDLGGHSLMATKLAARIGHRLDTTVSVKQVFDHPVLFHLASALALSKTQSYDVTNDLQNVDYAAFQLMSVPDVEDFVQREVVPQLNFNHGKIQDVYPASQMQKAFVCEPTTGYPKPLVPFYVDFPAESDATALIKACRSLIEQLDMFRTVFVTASDILYQVVLEQLDLAIETIETTQNVNIATSDFLDRVAKEPVRLGEPLIKVAILKQTSSVRVLLRLSHALYDGLSLERIVRHLHFLYSGKPLPPQIQFSRYMQYVDSVRKESHDFWRDVIQDAQIADLSQASGGSLPSEVGEIKALNLSKVISVPLQALRNSIITQATVFNYACALVMAKETGLKDVVFGRVVSGRQGLPVSWQNIVGPCTNTAPVRAHVDTEGDQLQQLRDMQDQYLLSLPFETLGFDEVKRNCTQWPETVPNYACCITYHNFEYHPKSEMETQQVELGILAKHVELRKEEPLFDLAMAGEVEPDGVHLQVSVIGKSRLFKEERIRYLLEEVCKTFEKLNLTL